MGFSRLWIISRIIRSRSKSSFSGHSTNVNPTLFFQHFAFGSAFVWIKHLASSYKILEVSGIYKHRLSDVVKLGRKQVSDLKPVRLQAITSRRWSVKSPKSSVRCNISLLFVTARVSSDFHVVILWVHFKWIYQNIGMDEFFERRIFIIIIVPGHVLHL